MSDNLVKMCRRLSRYAHAQISGADLERIADRIEELEAKLATREKYRDAYAECDRIGTQAVRELEAKLVKAVRGLEDIADGMGEVAKNEIERFAPVVARATLAELTGGKDE